MAYLLDPQHDKRILREPGTAQQAAPEEDEEARTMLLTAVRAARSGDRRTLTNMLKRPSFREVLHRWQGGLTYDELMGMPEEPSDELLARLLQLELALSRSGNSDDTPKDTSWSRIVQRDGVAPVPSLTLETLTDYDPRKCLFRDGQWVAPETRP
jgi:hypothetical protein